MEITGEMKSKWQIQRWRKKEREREREKRKRGKVNTILLYVIRLLWKENDKPFFAIRNYFVIMTSTFKI